MKWVLFFFGVFGLAVTGQAGIRPSHALVGDDIYVHDLAVPSGSLHYDWLPGDSVCPVPATNAVRLAIHAFTNIAEGVTVYTDRARVSLLPTDRDRGWCYQVEIPMAPTDEPSRFPRRMSFRVAVHLDGSIPEIKKGSLEELKEKYAWLEKLYRDDKDRAIVRGNLRQYQMEVMRAGMAPLPIPLTQEMDDQLVAEGVLPPQKNVHTNSTHRRFGGDFRRQADVWQPELMPELTPEEQAKKREEVRENLRKYQMAVIQAGMPPLPLSPSQALEDELIKVGALLPVASDVPLSENERRERNKMAWAYIRANKEFQNQMVDEGLLPSIDALPPGVVRKQEKDIRLIYQYEQMNLIRNDNPLLSSQAIKLTTGQKKQLMSEGIIFLDNGSISNSVTGFCHPPPSGAAED